MSNPHDILDEVIPFSEFPDYEYIKKPSKYFSKQCRFIRVVRDIWWNLFVFYFILKRKIKLDNNKFILREYDFFSLILLAIPGKTRIIFNVNHNLSTRYGVLCSKILSYRYCIMMLDGSDEMMVKHPHFVFKSSDSFFTGNSIISRKIVIFLGSRSEQRDYEPQNVTDLVNNLVARDIDVTCLGSNYGNNTYLSEPEFNKTLDGSIGIILFGKNYQDRHSGSVWTVARKCSGVIVPSKGVFRSQVRCNPNTWCYGSLEELERIVDNIFK
jgi:hypothetical protein